VSSPGWSLITGAGRGIGRAIALALSQRGASVILAARTEGELESTARACRDAGAPATEVVPTDLADPAAVDALAQHALDAHQAIDVLVNNAGIFAAGHALDGDPDHWSRMMQINALAPMRLIRRLSPAMVARERGAILNIGSIAAIEGMKITAAYAATKHALRGFSLSTYERLREHGIKVVLINPAFVDTEMSAGIPGVRHDRMLTATDVASAAMLALDTSAMCCPSEITLRLTKRADT
jgi:short-subunit dehydrogenase